MSKKLWKHQRYAIDKYKDRPFFGLLFSCGLGKTLTTIRIAEEKDRPVLIIAPNALTTQWVEEIEKNKEKEWEVMLCTRKTKNTKKFKEAFQKFCEE